MSRSIEDAFSKGKAFIPFITCGDPTLEISEKLVYAMEDAGADIIELGIPFSDPVAEGPAIMAADERALHGGVTTDKTFDMTERIRDNTDIPLVFMTYANVVYSYGIEKFCIRAERAGIQGIILPDVPFEEKEEFEKVFADHGMVLISMIAPTSGKRIAMIAKEAKGFLYMVPSPGAAEMGDNITTDIGAMTAKVKEVSKIPCAVGFEISDPAQARQMALISDGVIVGSAIVKLCDEYGEACVPYVKEFVKEMKDAIRDL